MRRRNHLERLESVIRIAEDEEKRAFSELSDCRQRLHQQEAQLEDLAGYLDEYRAHIRSSDGVVGIGLVRNRFSFLLKLEDAVGSQRNQVELWREREGELRQAWMEKRVRSRALSKASAQRRELFQRNQRRQEQKRSDELSRNQITGSPLQR